MELDESHHHMFRKAIEGVTHVVTRNSYDFNAEQLAHEQETVSWLTYIGSSNFWESTLQNWQSPDAGYPAGETEPEGGVPHRPHEHPEDVAEDAEAGQTHTPGDASTEGTN